MEECQLRDPGPDVGHDDTDADHPSAGERPERDPLAVDVVLEGAQLSRDGVFAVTLGVPGRRGPVAGPGDELAAVLVVEHVDALRTIDLADARQLGPAQPAHLDRRLHHLTLAHATMSWWQPRTCRSLISSPATSARRSCSASISTGRSPRPRSPASGGRG